MNANNDVTPDAVDGAQSVSPSKEKSEELAKLPLDPFSVFVAAATANLQRSSDQPRTSSPVRPTRSDSQPFRVPLSKLSTNLSGRWTVTARVTTKSSIQSYKRPRGGAAGSVMSAQLCDDTYRARIVAFDANVPQINSLKVGRVYTFSNLEIRALPKVAVVSPDQLQLYCTAHSTWREAEDPAFDNFPDLHASPVNYTDLPQFVGTYQTADIFGILLTVSAVQVIRSSKTGETFSKQVIGLGNQRGEAVQIVLWGINIACCTSEMVGQILAVTDTVVKSGDGTKFSLASGRLSEVHDISETPWEQGRALLAFRDGPSFSSQTWLYLSSDSQFQSAINLKVLAVLDAAARDRRARPNYDVLVEAHQFATTPRSYQMCPTPGCKRSLAPAICRVDSDTFKCSGCAATCTSAQMDVGYCAELEIGDATYRGSVLLFNECVATVVGVNLAQFKAFQETNGADYYNALRHSLHKWFLMRIGFGDDRRMVANAMRPVDNAEACKLCGEIMAKNEEGINRIVEERID